MTISSFSSVKLPSDLVQQARDAAQPLRRSAAGQIEYWATLGRVVEHSGLTVQEARRAIENYEAAGRFVAATPDGVTPDTLGAIKKRVLAVSSNGTLQTQLHRTVTDNRHKADRGNVA